MMTSTARDGLMSLAKGGGAIVWLLWGLMSFAPAVDLVYGANGTSALLNWLFMVTGPGFILLPLYTVRFTMYMEERHQFDAWMRGKWPVLTLFGAAWITAYAFI
jgi:hypothetical protein